MSGPKPVQRALVMLQAAVAAAALGERELARRRVDEVMGLLALPQLLPLAKVMADFLDKQTLVNGPEWAVGKPVGLDEEPEDLPDRERPARVLTLRLMSAWSSQDPASFDALFLAAAADPEDGREHIADLFVYVLDWVEHRAERVISPAGYVRSLCRSMNGHAPSAMPWADTR